MIKYSKLVAILYVSILLMSQLMAADKDVAREEYRLRPASSSNSEKKRFIK